MAITALLAGSYRVLPVTSPETRPRKLEWQNKKAPRWGCLLCVQPGRAKSDACNLVASSREDEVLRAGGGSGVADLIAEAARGNLLHGAVTQEDVAGVLVDRAGVADLVQGRDGDGSIGVGGREDDVLASQQSLGRAVGHVAVAAQDALGLLFSGSGAEEVARNLLVVGEGQALHTHPGVGGGEAAAVGRAPDDLRGAQLIRHGSEGGGDVVRDAGCNGAGRGGVDERDTALIGRNLPGVGATEVHREGAEGQTDVLEVVDAGDAVGARLGLGQSRQEHAGQNRDDGDNDEQLDQRESAETLFAETIHRI